MGDRSQVLTTTIPPYPSTSARKTLSPSQLAKLNGTILTCITNLLYLPPSKRDTSSAYRFVSSYAKDAAIQTLQTLIWDNETAPSKVEKLIRIKVLQLAEKLEKLDVRTLLDLSIAYAKTNSNRLCTVLEFNSASLNTTDLVSSFVLLLRFDNSPGLYALRKASHCVSAFLHVTPAATLRGFAHSKEFILALANAYQTGLGGIASSYGGLSMDGGERTADDWEKLWLETKVSFMDAFHACIVCLLKDLASASGLALAAEAEVTFDIIFTLLETDSTTEQNRTPFLNQSILADHQQSYNLLHTLSSSIQHALERDARLDLLEARLQDLETPSEPAQAGKKNPGALKLLLRSSGALPGIDNRGNANRQRMDKGKDKEKENEIHSTNFNASVASTSQIPHNDANLDIQISQVLDILPDQPPEYIRSLLLHPSYPFAGHPDAAERVIGALLEGTAPPWDEVRNASKAAAAAQNTIRPPAPPPIERRNIFDEEEVDTSKFRLGKKSENDPMFLRDRETLEQMKADILRRVEEFSSSDDEDDGKADDSEDEQLISTAVNKIKVGGDGEDSDASDSEDRYDSDHELRTDPETLVELAYIENPRIFDRDSATRSSEARRILEQRTGWKAEQIEGWRIMLDRDPKRKEKIMKKHEWAGNKHSTTIEHPEVSSSRGGRGRGRGRGGDRGRGDSVSHGRGRDRGGGGPSSAQERARKERNKNQVRKRGHDKKVARSGVGQQI
ncbi:hypothetical protein EV361DRAFT_903013 [Lentinula raphanica]|nr:hypothetical protein EV361DRAFT_903013 [Lentinula raphanica]